MTKIFLENTSGNSSFCGQDFETVSSEKKLSPFVTGTFGSADLSTSSLALGRTCEKIP